MIVRRGDFHGVVEKLSAPGVRSLDTETTGLRMHHTDVLFSIIFHDGSESYYFNFQSYPAVADEWCLPRSWLRSLAPVLGNPESKWFLANAKFDLGFLKKEGLEISGDIHCVEAIGRVVRNDELSYSLDSQAQRIGLSKSSSVMEYVKEHKLWEWVEIPEKGKREKKLFFNRVPLDVIAPYGEQDATVTFALGQYQTKSLIEMAASGSPAIPPITMVLENERRLTKTLFRMEQTGILVDRDYCIEAIRYEESRAKDAASEFTRISDINFRNAPSILTAAFSRLGYNIPKTEKGNACFNDEVLSKINNPLTQAVKKYRDAHKKISTYYQNFLYHADQNGVIHANVRQGGTNTGRMSYSDPNLQNLPDEEEEISAPYRVRRAFVPRPGRFFIMPDYKTMEYVMLLDYAGEMELIQEVRAGKDLHQATADLFGATRKEAKTLNFGLLYGMGVATLADALGVSVQRATQLRSQYFRALPRIEQLIKKTTERARTVGYVYNWLGRKYTFSDRSFAFTAINKIIQGGCADVLKLALNRIDSLLLQKESKLVLSVHDEIIVEMVPEEIELIPKILEIMSSAYPHRHLPLTVDLEHSFKSLGDKCKGMPHVSKTGNEVST